MSSLGSRGPDFLIIGGMKCGTTSLFNYLVQHPRIIPPKDKELHYYDIHLYKGRTLEEYIAQFPKRLPGVLSGEGTPFYLTHPHCPAWVQRDFPDVQLIVVMRNPVDRFWSQFNQMKRYRHYEGSPEDAIAFEEANGEQEWMKVLADPHHPVDDLKMCSLLRRGCYADQLANWLRHFHWDQFLLLFTEELREERLEVVNRAFDFLGLEARQNLALETLHHTQEYGPMPADLREKIEAWYRPHNERLADLIDRELPWDN